MKSPKLFVISPVSYIESISLIKNAKFVLTDSGGLQHEATILGIPCLTMRENTEWPITIKNGTNVLVGVLKNKIIKEVFSVGDKKINIRKIKYWDGKTAERIIKILNKKLNAK